MRAVSELLNRKLGKKIMRAVSELLKRKFGKKL